MTSGGLKFSINFEHKHDVKMYNEKNAEIEKRRFEQIVKVYWRDASFRIKLLFYHILFYHILIICNIQKIKHAGHNTEGKRVNLVWLC